MRSASFHRYVPGKLLWLGLAVLLMRPLGVSGATEEVFDVLQIGSRTYTNVTVTTKAKSYIFILHTGGMASVKVSELSPDLQEKLGYASAMASKVTTNAAAVWVKKEMAKIDVAHVKDLKKQVEQKWRGHPGGKGSAMGLVGPTLIFAVLGIMLLLYLFYCYCCMLICQKTGNLPGILVWVPVVQLFPLLRAAGMSGWWFLAFLVPGINLVAHILWSLKIAKARGKSVWVGVLLLLPVTNLFAFLYLAFSDGSAGADDEETQPKVMSLQSA